MTGTDRRGFTLVELLVVIVIISMLMGLLVPAINRARASALRAKCVNNQAELGKAILAYENAKQRFPGYANSLTGAAFPVDSNGKRIPLDVSWVVVILEYLGRKDLSDLWMANQAPAAGSIPTVPQLTCPTDPEISQNLAGSGPLSYLGNPRIFRNRSTTGKSALGAPVGPDLMKAVTATDLKSTQQTVLFMETNYNAYAAQWSAYNFGPNYNNAPGLCWSNAGTNLVNNGGSNTNVPNYQICFFWDPPDSASWSGGLKCPLAIDWADASTLDSNNLVGAQQLVRPFSTFSNVYDYSNYTQDTAVPPPLKAVGPLNHAGIVIVTFCDGHQEEMSADALCGAYFWGPPIATR
jgi:prepilin-type N-terminal cleavage/methylation domain-containing protein